MLPELPNNEKELFFLLAEGNEDAFRKIFHTYNAKLFPFIHNLTRSEAEAEEIMQNVFLKLWLHRSSLQNIENHGGWLYRVASNMALKFLRNKATSMKLEKVLQESQSETDIDLQQQLDAAELKNLVAEAVEKLPPGQRQVFVLSRTEGLNRQEIAQRMAISESTVKNQLGSALKFIQSYIQKKHGLNLPIILFLPLF